MDIILLIEDDYKIILIICNRYCFFISKVLIFIYKRLCDYMINKIFLKILNCIIV